MQARIVAASRGAAWLAEGWRLFRAAPAGWLALAAGYWLLMTAASLVPYAGVAIAAATIPAFTVGFMAAARAASRGAALSPMLLFEGFRVEARAQAGLGLVYLASLALVLGASAAFDDGALARSLLAGVRPEDEVLASGDYALALVVAAVAYTPVMMLFWFAPPLAAWHATGAPKALFFSFFACLMNWRALLVYGALASVLAMALGLLVLALAAMAAGRGAQSSVPAFFVALMVFLLPTIYASFYAGYRDVFAAPAPTV